MRMFALRILPKPSGPLTLGLIWVIGSAGCGSNEFAGKWSGSRVESDKAKKMKSIGYSTGKRYLNSSFTLEADGTYTAKLEEIDTTGDWSNSGKGVTLTPKTYMGMEKANFPAPKTGTGINVAAKIYEPYFLEGSSNVQTLTHRDELGVTTFTKLR